MEPLTDVNHVKDAIARFDQTIDVSDENRELAFANIRKTANYYGIDMTETDWTQLGRSPHTGGRRRTVKCLHLRLRLRVRNESSTQSGKRQASQSCRAPRLQMMSSRGSPRDDELILDCSGTGFINLE